MVKRNHNLETVNVQLLSETERAWFVDDGTKRAWIPKSQAELAPNGDGTYTLEAPEWLLTEKELL